MSQQPDPMTDGVFRWAWRRATALWSGAATTFLVAVLAWLFGRYLWPSAEGLLGHVLPPFVVLLLYFACHVLAAGVGQRDALRDAARKHDEDWHPLPDVRFSGNLYQQAPHVLHYRVEVSNLPPGEYEATGRAINADAETWTIPWGENATERARKPGGGTDMVRLAAINWRPNENRLELVPFRTGIDRDPHGRLVYRWHRPHGYDGNRVSIRFDLRGDSLADSYYEVVAEAWWDNDAPHTKVVGTIMGTPLVGA